MPSNLDPAHYVLKPRGLAFEAGADFSHAKTNEKMNQGWLRAPSEQVRGSATCHALFDGG